MSSYHLGVWSTHHCSQIIVRLLLFLSSRVVRPFIRRSGAASQSLFKMVGSYGSFNYKRFLKDLLGVVQEKASPICDTTTSITRWCRGRCGFFTWDDSFVTVSRFGPSKRPMRYSRLMKSIWGGELSICGRIYRCWPDAKLPRNDFYRQVRNVSDIWAHELPDKSYSIALSVRLRGIPIWHSGTRSEARWARVLPIWPSFSWVFISITERSLRWGRLRISRTLARTNPAQGAIFDPVKDRLSGLVAIL